jgi:hypothetical protein
MSPTAKKKEMYVRIIRQTIRWRLACRSDCHGLHHVLLLVIGSMKDEPAIDEVLADGRAIRREEGRSDD